MLFNNNKQMISKRFGAWVLILFVVSWMNLGIQSPAHAAMQGKMQNQSMADMSTANSQPCHCPPSLCEAVLSLDNQSTDSSFASVSLDDILRFQPVMAVVVDDLHHSQSLIRLNHSNWQYRQISPPPISLTSLLLI